METFAEHRLEVLYADGELHSVCIRVGLPRPHPEGDYVCPVQAEGLRLWQGPKDFCGISSFHALTVGIRFLYEMLSIEVEQGAVLYWEGTKEPVDLVDLFSLKKRPGSGS